MRTYSTFGLTAVAAVLASSATAEARPHHHHRAKDNASTRAQLRQAQEEISQLQAQLNTLQARMDKQAAPAVAPEVAAAQAAAQSAQASADAASAKADQAVAEANTAKAQAAHADAHVDKGLDLVKWAGNTQVGGLVYFNASNINQHTNNAGASGIGANTNNPNSGTGFNVKRIYLNITHQFSPIFSARLTTDISNAIGETATTNYVTPTTTPAPCPVTTSGTPPKTVATCAATNLANASLTGKGLYVKYAYVEAKPSGAFWVRLGSAPLPWVPYMEDKYGFRHIENVAIDRLGYGTSADWGAHVGGDLAGGLISYQASAIDGGGYRNVKVTRTVDFEGRLSAQYKGFWAALGGYVGKRGNNVEFNNGVAAGQNPLGLPSTFRTARRGDAAAGYQGDVMGHHLGFGGEYFYAKNWNNVTINPATNVYSQDSANGWSVFANASVAPKWTVFGRYDEAKTNRITNPGLSDHYFNIGLQWEPVKIVDLALVYKRETADNGAISTTNGVIGCATSATPNSYASVGAQTAGNCIGNGTYDEIGIWGQLKF